MVDDAVRVALGGGTVLLPGVIGLLPLGAEAAVRLRALSRATVRLGRHPPTLLPDRHRAHSFGRPGTATLRYALYTPRNIEEHRV
jgi:hypothetical protein